MMRQRMSVAAGLIGLLLSASVSTAIDWSSDYLATPTVGTTNLAMNFSQWPCTVDLPNSKYRWNAGAGWTSESTTSINALYNYDYTNLCFDTLGYPHTLYVKHDDYGLHHLYRNSSGWHDELLVSNIGNWQRIVIGPDNVYHVVYNKNYDVYYMRHTSSGWSTPVAIGSSDNEGYYGDRYGGLALDSDNRPHVVHHQNDSPYGIEHVWWDGHGWQTENVEAISGSSYYASKVAVDGKDRVCVLFHKSGDTVKYACKDRDGWHMSVAATGQTKLGLSLCLDYHGLPRAAVVNGSQVSYLQYDGSSWYSQAAASGNCDWPVLALNLSGEPFIAYDYNTSNYQSVARPQYYPPGAFTLLDPANGAWASASPMFRWNPCSYLGDSLSRYELWIDGAYNDSVTPPTVTACRPASPLSAGWHNWKVLAIKTTGDSIWSSSSWSVHIDATSPSAFNLQSPANDTWTVQRHPTLSWTASSDDESGLRKYQVIIDGYKADDSVPASQTSTQTLVSLPDGSHTWSIRAVDNVGNVTSSNQTWTVKVDSTGPAYFSLISPSSYSYTGNPRPTFVWHRTTDAGVGMRCYQLWVRPSGGQWQLKQDSITDTTYALLPGQALTDGTWYWEVAALDSLGNQTTTSYWTLYVDLQPPLPFDLVSPPNNGAVPIPTPTFTWRHTSDASSGLSHYELWIDSVLNVDNLSDTFSAPASPLAEGNHRWFVQAVDKVGNVRVSNQTWTVEVDTHAPGIPTLLEPVGDSWQRTPTVFHWTAVSFGAVGLTRSTSIRTRSGAPGPEHGGTGKPFSAVSYIMQVDTSPNFTPPLVIDTTRYTQDTISLAERHYFWRVRAFDAAGNQGQFSGPDSFRVDSTAPTVPLLVAPPNDTTLPDTSVLLVWNHSTDQPSGVAGYRVQLAYDSGFASVLRDTTLADTTCEFHLPDSLFYWHVRAIDRAGNKSSWSPRRRFGVDTHAPGIPTLLEPIGGAWRRTPTVFQWTAVSFGAVGLPRSTSVRTRSGTLRPERGSTDKSFSLVKYIMQVDTSTNFTPPLVVDTTTFTQDTISLAEHRYFWRVKAFDAAGNQGHFTGADSFGVDTAAPTVPLLVAPPNDTTLPDSTVLLVWNHSTDQPSGVAAYRVQVAYDTAFASVLRDTTLADTTREFHLPESLFYWHVRATDRAGNVSSWSLRRRFRDTIWVNVEEPGSSVPLEFGLLLPFPQPFSASVRLVYGLAKAEDVNLAVYDATGRRAKVLIDGKQTAGLWSVTWDGTGDSRGTLPRGTYFCQLRAGEFTALRKMVKTE